MPVIVGPAIISAVGAFRKVSARIARVGAATDTASLTEGLISLILIFQLFKISQVVHNNH